MSVTENLYIYIYIYIYIYAIIYVEHSYRIEVISAQIYSFNNIDLVGRVLANGPEDLGSIPGRVIPKTLKMVLDTSLLSTQQYKVRIEGKVEQSREKSSALPYTLV